MNFLLCSFIVTCLLAAVECQDENSNCSCGRPTYASSRIIGGQEAQEGDFPSPVYLLLQSDEEKRASACGGVILTKRHVVTAAQCMHYLDRDEQVLVPRDLEGVIVYYNQITIDLYGNNYAQVEKIDIHEGFDTQAKVDRRDNDIAVVTIIGEFPMEPFISACFPKAEEVMPKDFTGVVTMGWGETGEERFRASLNEVWLDRIWNVEECNTNGEARFDPASNNQICASAPGKSVCVGDTGGPLLFPDIELQRYILIGIISFPSAYDGNQNCDSESGFTNVGAYRDWILSKLGDEEACIKS